MRMKTTLLLLSFMFLSVDAFAQQTTGNLEGVILDENGEPVTQAQVTVTGTRLQGQRDAIISSRGFFQILSLPVGLYRVEVSLIGYQDVAIEDVAVRLGRTTDLGEIELTVQAIEMAPMVITAERPTIDPASTVLGINFEAEEYNDLPVERDYRHIAALMPQANESFLGDEVNVAGATGMANKYFVDGVEVTDPLLGHQGMILPHNFVKETQVRAGAYEAEYRSSLGGVMEAITYSGGNEFEGQIFGFFDSDRMTGSARSLELEPNTGDYSNYDIGFSLGGPIVRDRLWFFGAYDPNREVEDVEIPGLDFYEDRRMRHAFAGKVNGSLSDRTSLTFTMLGCPYRADMVSGSLLPMVPITFENPDPYLLRLERDEYSFSIDAKHIVNDALFIDVDGSRYHNHYQLGPATERGGSETLFIEVDTKTFSGGTYGYYDDRSVVNTVSASGTWISGAHTLKSGIEYKHNALDYDEVLDGVFWYEGDAEYWRFEWNAVGSVANRIPSAYIQDSWRVNEQWRINAGLRWDGQFLVGSDGKVAQEILGQWQPRLGVTWLPGAVRNHKVFGSYGRFYQEVPTSVLQNYYIEGLISRWTYYDHDPRTDPTGGEVITDYGGDIQTEVDGMKGQYFDEFTLGYEREVELGGRIGVRGIYRTLGRALEDGFDPETGQFWFGNPGSGPLSAYPDAKREYTALELSYRKTGGERFNYFASYVLSRNRGNYAGITENGSSPNYSFNFDYPEAMQGAYGLLPNDRTHVFKFNGSYRVGYGLTTGTSLYVMSGTPLSERGGTERGFPTYQYLGGRGNAGRTPTIWDLNLRFSYDLSYWLRSRLQPRFLVDIFHVGSLREATDFDQIHFRGLDEEGNQAWPNATYGQAIGYQPPMSVRVGMEMNF
jgi:hypothetical protein